MPQDIFNLTGEDLDKLLKSALGGGLPGAEPLKPSMPSSLTKPAAPPMPTSFPGAGPQKSPAAAYLDKLLGSKALPSPTPAGASAATASPLPTAEEEPIDTSEWDKPVVPKNRALPPGMSRASVFGMGGVTGLATPGMTDEDLKALRQMSPTGVPKKTKDQLKEATIYEKLRAEAPADQTKFEQLLDENLKETAAIVKNPLGVLEGTGYNIVQLPAAAVGAVLTGGKALFNIIAGNGKGWGDAEQFGNKAVQSLTAWAEPRSAAGKAVARAEMLPIEAGLGAWDSMGKKISSDPNFQASWRWVGNVSILLAAGGKHAGKPQMIGKYRAIGAEVKPGLVKKLQSWFAEETKQGRTPTPEAAKAKAAELGIDQSTLDTADQMLRNWEDRGLETPEGRLAPTKASGAPTTVTTPDGTTVTVTPPKAAPGRIAGVPTEARETYRRYEREQAEKAVQEEAGKPPAPPKMARVSVPEPQAEGAMTYRPREFEVTVKAGPVKKKSGQIKFWDENGVGYTEAQAKELAAKSPDGSVALFNKKPTPEQLAREKAASAANKKAAEARIPEAARLAAEKEAAKGRTSTIIQQELVKLNDTIKDTVERGDTENIVPYLEESRKALEAELSDAINVSNVKGEIAAVEREKSGVKLTKIDINKQASEAKIGTFNRQEAWDIIQSVEKADGRDGLRRLAAGFGIDLTGMTKKQAYGAIGTELMKVQKRKSAIQDVFRKADENLGEIPQGMEDVPPPDFEAGAVTPRAEPYPWEQGKTPEMGRKRPPEAKSAPAPAREPSRPGKSTQAQGRTPSRQEIERVTTEESARYDKTNPPPRDAAGFERWKRDKAGFVGRVVANRMRKGPGANAGFFGAGEIQNIYEAWKEARDKGAENADSYGKLGWLMEQYNKFAELAMARDTEKGWDSYKAVDARVQMGLVERSIGRAWQELRGGIGRMTTELVAKTQEGRDAQTEIGRLNKRLTELDEKYTTLTRGERTQAGRWRQVGPGEYTAAKLAGLEVQTENARYGGFVREEFYEAEKAVGRKDITEDLSRIHEEQVDITRRITDLEPKVGELTVRHALEEGARPPVSELPEPIVRKKAEPGALTKAEQKFYENLYTEEDWLARAATEAKKRAKKPEEKAIITPERLGHQRVWASMSLLEEQVRKARARKQPIRADQLMAAFPKNHPLYQPLYDALKAGDLKKFDRVMSNARGRLLDYAAEEGRPYTESPAIETGKPEPETGPPEPIVVEPGQPGVLRDRAGRRVRPFEPPREEAGPVQFYRQDAETQAADQQQWRRSMKDLHRTESPGLPGHFSKADQFVRLYPEPPEGSPGRVIARANRINDVAVESIDRIITEGVKKRLDAEGIHVPSEFELTEAGKRVRSEMSIEERSRLPMGGATLEDAVRNRRADIWIKIMNRLNKEKSAGQLDQITNVVKDHLTRRYDTHEAMIQAIMDDVRDLPIAKKIFSYTSRIREGMFKDLTAKKAAPLEPWQIEQAVFDAYNETIGRAAEGGEEGFAGALAKELETAGMSEFGGMKSNQLNHVALKVLAQKIWDEKYLNDYSGGNPVKKRAIELMLKEGDSAPVAQFRLQQEFGERAVPTKPENIAAWAGSRDKATGELTGYVRYIADKMDDWGPDAVRMFKKLADPVLKEQELTGAHVDSPASIMRTYFDPIIKRLDSLKERMTTRQKVNQAIEERRTTRAAEKAALEKEAAEQRAKVEASPEDYNIIDVEDTEAPGYPWEDEPGGGTDVGFLGGGQTQRIYEAMSRGIKNFMRDLRETRTERSARIDTEAGTHKFESPEAQARWERAYRATRRAEEGRWDRFRKDITRIYHDIPNDPRFAPFIDRLKWLEKEGQRSQNEATKVYMGDVMKYIDAETSPLTRRRLEDSFAKKVFLADLKEMYDGGATKFPQGFTRETIPEAIAHLDRFISELSGPERSAINAAIEARKASFERLTSEIIAEGDKAGYDFRDIFNRKNYYRHELLEYYDGLVRGGKKMKPNTYSWGMKRRAEGYVGDVVTDVRMVDSEIMSRLVAERDRLKVHNLIDEAYNIHDRVAAEAEARGISMKEAYDTLIPDGYTIYQFDKNHLIFNSMTISERFAQKILEGRLNEITPREIASIRERMAIGPKRDPWIIPTEMAKTLDTFSKPGPEPWWLAKEVSKASGYWKAWKLLGPKRILKFQFRNLTGDAEAHVLGNPSTFTKVGSAVRMLDDYFRKGVASPEILEWIDMGGMDTTFHWAEVGDFQRLFKWSEKLGGEEGWKRMPVEGAKKAWNTYADWAKRSSDLREGTLRLASYLDYRDQIVKNNLSGMGEIPSNYGASLRHFINALPDVKSKAFWLSNELSGAYDLVSPFGKNLRQTIVPFWSWKEITAKRYYRMMKNAAIDGMTAKEIGGRIIHGAPYAALKVGKFVLKANAVMALLEALNHAGPAVLGDPEAEEKLPQDVQGKPHITFGRLPWEKEGTGHYFSQVGMANDILDFFGMDAPPKMALNFIKDLSEGRVPDLENIAKDWWKDQPMINHVFQSLTPFIKIPTDIAYGKKTYPNLMNPRGIRDPFEYVADQMDLGSEYRMIKGRPGRDNPVQYLEKYFDYQHEEDETAYFDWIGVINDFKKGRGANTIGYSVTPKSNYLYWFKRARADGDMETAGKMFKRYIASAALEGGYKGRSAEEITKGIVQSLRQSYMEMFPLAQMTPYEIAELGKTLPERKKKILVRALRYWTNVIVGPDDAPGIVAEIEENNQEE